MRALVLTTLVVCGCTAGSSGSGGSAARDDVNPGDRKILGVPEGYPADHTLRARQDELDASMTARRAAAWAAVAKVLAPTPLQLKGSTTVPRFQTWYAKDDFVRMYKKLYKDLGPDGRKARAPFASDALTAIFPWNGTMVDELPTWPADRFAQYLAKLQTPEQWMGEGAGNRVGYSPSVMTHFFRNYEHILRCNPAAVPSDAAPVSDDNFTACYDSEFPDDAVIVKAAWLRAEFGAKVPAYDPARTRPDGDWGPGDEQLDPGPDQIHTVALSNGNRFRLAGLHIMTKELRKWMWITVWWSPHPASTDRPDSIGGVWRNYDMCVVTSPGQEWCSNPYLEKGPGNARTNCIGCHQHAGSSLTSEQILQLPEDGRREVRANFPTDYLWAFDHTDRLSRVIVDEAAYYDTFEK